ncbi:MAG: MotA/TolQ/ExbB proton channel family protein [Gammaproteobacteria bacterium]|nr:MotA/TolQ/ExbB proton channel family protein [Gammaproteobacteria bacterium]
MVSVPEAAVGLAQEKGGAATWLYRYLLALRFALFNVVIFGLVAAIYLQGWLDGALEGYTAWLSAGIFLVFCYGLALCGDRIWRVSRELNDVRSGALRPGSRAAKYVESVVDKAPEARNLRANVLRFRIANHISVVRHTANSLVFLGLVGTVIGFIVALSAVDPQSSVSVENVAPMVATLINGMSIALYTTLLGAVLHLWLLVNYRMLATGAMHLFNAIVDLGERRVGN